MSTFNELIDFTRSTTGTYLDSVVYGDNVAPALDFNVGNNWTNAGSPTAITSNSFSTVSSGAGYYANAFEVGKTYLVVVDYVGAGLQIRNGTTGGSPLVSNSSSSGTMISTFIASNPYMYLRATNGSVYTIDNVSVKEVIGGQVSGTPLLRTAAINEPRLEYDASGNPLGLLIEEARTNVLAYSNRLSGSSWQGTNCSITTDSTTSPDGSINASKVTCSVDGGTSSVWQYAISSGLNGNYSNSLYLKADTLNYAQLNVGYLVSSFVANFDLINGTVTHILGTGATITDVGNGWFRCTLPFNTLGSGGFGVTPIDSMSSIRRSGAVGSVFVYGAQTEVGSFPTSYIPTSGSAVTRAKDLASLPVERFAFNDTKGSVVVSAEMVTSSSSKGIASFKGNASLENIGLYEIASGNMVYEVRSSSTNQASYNVPLAFNNFKVGYVFKTNDFNLAVNGTAYTTDTSGVVPTGLSTLLIGSIYDVGTNLMNGHIKQIQYYPKRLSNEELELLTQPSASPTMNLTFDGQATSTLVEGLHD